MTNSIINVARDFSEFPAGRIYDDGDFSAQKFREEILKPLLLGNPSNHVTVELDGVAGYSSSFLEEAFGGLVREYKISKDTLDKQLDLVSDDKNLIEEIRQYINEA